MVVSASGRRAGRWDAAAPCFPPAMSLQFADLCSLFCPAVGQESIQPHAVSWEPQVVPTPLILRASHGLGGSIGGCVAPLTSTPL
jgi:hypothetical protein